MKRREMLRAAGTAAAAGAALVACGRAPAPGDSATPAAPTRHAWRMVTTWPPGFAGLGTGAVRLAERITQASGGRIDVSVHGGGELVQPFEVFDAVSAGKAELGHSASYYWKAKSEAAPFFCAVPFGLNALEMNAWLLHGGGLALWRELYARFDLVPFPAGNTGTQMAGWSNREITSLADMKGLRMRIPGLGGEVIARIGAIPVSLPGAEIYNALQAGTIDAAEWIAPFNDVAFGLHKVARYCYYPGWQEPGPTIECMINRKAWEALPEDLRAVVEACCLAANTDMLAEFTAQNALALESLAGDPKIQFRRLPERVLGALRKAAGEVLDAVAARDPFARRVWDSQRAFRERMRGWHAVSEVPYYQARG
ncbi:MAG TPA: TRAP transporter substrate-binding protein DctP [Pseudomonadota bacterium]|nr:TRAP transporter substrate-binding protein DctP [Pseudomonadota bacterium]